MKVDKNLIYFFSFPVSHPTHLIPNQKKTMYAHLCFTTQIFQTQDVILHRMYHRDY